MAYVWAVLHKSWRNYSRSLPASPVAWLHPTMLQLADVVLSRPEVSGPVSARDVFESAVGAAQLSEKFIRLPKVHPQLAAAAGQQPDGMGGQMAAALQQVRFGYVHTSLAAVLLSCMPIKHNHIHPTHRARSTWHTSLA